MIAILRIIAGYKNALDKCFFNVNDGLRRRFSFSYDITEYSGEELCDIFVQKINITLYIKFLSFIKNISENFFQSIKIQISEMQIITFCFGKLYIFINKNYKYNW